MFSQNMREAVQRRSDWHFSQTGKYVWLHPMSSHFHPLIVLTILAQSEPPPPSLGSFSFQLVKFSSSLQPELIHRQSPSTSSSVRPIQNSSPPRPPPSICSVRSSCSSWLVISTCMPPCPLQNCSAPSAVISSVPRR